MEKRKITKRINRTKSTEKKSTTDKVKSSSQYKKDTEPNIYYIYKFPITAFLTDAEKQMKGFKKINDLCNSIENHTEQRILPADSIKRDKIISISPSAITRALKWQDQNPKKVKFDIIIISAKTDQKCYEDNAIKLFKNLVMNGFTVNSEEYIFFTASAGQIREREAMFIKKSEYEKIQNTVTCGLTWDRINDNGGIIANKYLAYTALCTSSSKEFKKISIDNCIVVGDFETDVPGLVDYIAINEDDCSITRQVMDVHINHTDGCGMILYSSENAMNKSKEAFTIRGPWIKGLLVPFDFVRFIKEADAKEPNVNHRTITDIYGEPHDVISEEIDVIFTKSQFKMSKYYKDWDEYRDNFKNYHCEFSKCKAQDDTVKYGRTSYQYLQTLTDISDNELKTICSATNRKLTQMCTDPVYMWNSHKFDKSKNAEHRPLWDAVSLYPALLTDCHTIAELRREAENIRNKALGGKLLTSSRKNIFLVPDLYAFCEYLFMGNTNPYGIISAGEVSCSLYKNGERLDCLRSPHWDRAHALRTNIRNADCKEWFCDGVCFFSCHDLITKVLQADFDGDTGLIVNFKTFTDIAERNMKDTVPLHYESKKGDPKLLTKETLFEGMVAAYEYSIGTLANPITKLWNKENIDANDLELIKVFTAASNYYTDYAKTLYAPVLPKTVQARKNALSTEPFPYFWRYTDNFKKKKNKKDKHNKPVAKINDSKDNMQYLHAGIALAPSKSTVDRIEENIIEKPDISINTFRKQVEGIDYTLMVNDPFIDLNPELIDAYRQSAKIDCLAPETAEDDAAQFKIGCSQMRKKLSDIEPDEIKVTDMLVKHLFGHEAPESRKSMFWEVYGGIVCNNLNQNLLGKKVCIKCLKYFIPKTENELKCPNCK